MAKEPPYVIVHGGVHKTATSYVQSILQRNANKMRKQGVHYIHHRDTRKDYTYPCQLNGYQKLGLKYRTKVPDKELEKVAKKFFNKIKAKPGERIILSDENLPGHCGQCVRSGELYNRREMLVPIFADHIIYPVTEVHIAIRNYADFFASAYVEFLRSASGEHIMSDTVMKRAVLSSLPSWLPYLQLLQKSFPNARLVIWRHEQFRALSSTVIGNLIGPGLDAAKLSSPKATNDRPSASHRAVQEILARAERIGGEAAIAQRVEIQDAFPRSPLYPGYDPWTADERDHLVRTYEKDIVKIRSQMDLTFLEP